jgi:tRNA-2-methylthio-N6-dimethylallyladenosine synthase
MNRGYTREEYLDKVMMIRQGIPGVVLSTDLIVGFPGETEAQFEDTRTLLEQVRYDNIYAFNYSPRPFTKAARWPDQLPLEEKQRRLDILLKLQREIAFDLARHDDGQVFDVLFERETDLRGQIQGRTTKNKIVFVDADASIIGQTLPVRILKAFPNVLRGEVVPSPSEVMA